MNKLSYCSRGSWTRVASVQVTLLVGLALVGVAPFAAAGANLVWHSDDGYEDILISNGQTRDFQNVDMANRIEAERATRQLTKSHPLLE